MYLLVSLFEPWFTLDGVRCLLIYCFAQKPQFYALHNLLKKFKVEDHGLCSSFFPFIVAEKDICSEIRTLESIIEAAETADGFLGATEELQARDQALDFIHEIGWLLHRSHLQFGLGSGSNLILFPFERFKWLIEFSVDHAWCAAVEKLLFSSPTL